MHIKYDCLWGDNVTAANLDIDSFHDKCGGNEFRKVKMDLEIRVCSLDLGGEMFNSNKR